MAMRLPFRAPDHDRRLLPEGWLAGPMPWVIAIMVFLTMLAAGAGLAIGQARAQLGDSLSSRVTVQIVEADAAMRARQQNAVVQTMRGVAAVTAVRGVPDAEARELVEPWLGAGSGVEGAIPVPALVDVSLARPVDDALLAQLRSVLGTVAPAARIDADSGWIAPVDKLMRSLQWIALGLVALLALATMATVVLAARGALDTHRSTIAIVHLLGGTDQQVTRLFQRRIALDALFGGLLGFGVGLAVLILLSQQFAQIGNAMVQAGTLPWYGWAVLLLVPILATVLAAVVARVTVLRNLKAML